MTFDEILAENYEENIRELEEERSKLVFRPEYDGTIVEKYVTCKRPNCICHRGYPHGPNKYFRHKDKDTGEYRELYLGKKIVEDYTEKVVANQRVKAIEKELRALRRQLTKVRERLGSHNENADAVQLEIDVPD